MRRSCFYRILTYIFIGFFCEISFVTFAEEPSSDSTVMKIDLDEDEPMDSDGGADAAPAQSAPAAKHTSSAPSAPAAASAPAPVNKAMLDEKRSKLREQLKRDRADSKRARSIRRNSELSREGLDEEEMELKRKLDYAKSHEEGSEQHQQEATESAKKFSQWVNQNMMINKDKKKAPEKTESEKILEEAKSSDDLLK
ncbi:hypothetical protein SAMN02745213_01758 [Succinivibrio dextrinosolvens DSM 3072]|uniref:Uncharacterized protein n=1 Tax=Succinivibrio dextrinosolvens DSM 3072 TaxID=1123324 RepID=A0A1T4VMB8_9GAMM|nr:hypothetical protein SAMN02745213_01758 [Succinivibrio dextrinosolvens DSM 3072]